MIGEEMRDTLKELTLEELRKITWGYSNEDVVGLYNDKIIRVYLWEAKEINGINPLVITRCNVSEGWVEYFECEVLPNTQNATQFFKEVKFKITEEGDAITRTKLDCKVVIDLLDDKGNVIVTLS